MKPTHPQPVVWLNEYGDLLFRYALIRVRSEETAEDLVQETLLAGLQAFKNFNGKSSVSTWLISILKHKIIDFFRKNRNEAASYNADESMDELIKLQFDDRGHWKMNLVEWNSPEQSFDEEQFWQVFQHCLAKLPVNMANLFMLRVVDGLSSEDCCKLLEMNSTNQLWVNLSRVRMKLRQCLDIYWFNQE